MASILDWYDDIMKEYKEFEEIARGVDPEFFGLFEAINEYNNYIYPLEAVEDGIKHWEDLLGLKVNRNDTLEERRFRVVSKLNMRLPYTEIQLRRILGKLLGYDGFSLSVEGLILTMSLAERNNSKVQVIYEMLNEIVPMNVLIELYQLVKRYATAYSGGYIIIGETVRIMPWMVEEINCSSTAYAGGYTFINNKVRIEPRV